MPRGERRLQDLPDGLHAARHLEAQRVEEVLVHLADAESARARASSSFA